jgi:hypothetical protein
MRDELTTAQAAERFKVTPANVRLSCARAVPWKPDKPPKAKTEAAKPVKKKGGKK